jgi:N-acetylglutamate synthase-like GNAT family acetyltransferase
MRASVRRATTSDVQEVVELITAYSREVFEREALVTREALLHDGFGSVLEFFVAESSSGALTGFAAWEKTYDVISGRRGGALLGQFVAAKLRGDGIGHALLNAVANEVRAMGGVFLSGLGGAHAELAGEAPPNLDFHGGVADAPRRQAAADLSLAELTSLGESLYPDGRR